MLLLKKITRSISVYTGISPALLASISMGTDVKANNMQELVQAMAKKGILEEKGLMQILSSVDRAWFTQDRNPYSNKPCKISSGECMTDPLTQFITLQRLYHIIKSISAKKANAYQGIRILDIGCGHGYISVSLWNILRHLNLEKGSSVLGVDIYQECIQKAKDIKEKYVLENSGLGFMTADISGKDSMVLEPNKYDVVTCGFFVEDSLNQRILQSLNQGGGGVWPISDQNQQRLFTFQKDQKGNAKKEYIFSTLFSPQRKILDKRLEKFFVEYEDGEESNKSTLMENDTDQSTTLEKERIARKKLRNQKLKEEAEKAFKQWQSQFKAKHGRIPKLQQIRQDSVGSVLLLKLNGK